MRLQILEREPLEIANKVRDLLKETQSQAKQVTDDEITAKVRLVRTQRCAS